MLFQLILRRADGSQPFTFVMAPHLIIIMISRATITGFRKPASAVPTTRADHETLQVSAPS
jgi:hypothetical protein